MKWGDAWEPSIGRVCWDSCNGAKEGGWGGSKHHQKGTIQGGELHWEIFVTIVRGGQVATCGGRDNGYYDEDEASEENGKIENGYKFPTISKWKGVDYK